MGVCMTTISKKFSIVVGSLLLVLSLGFIFQPQQTDAANCYKSGYSTFSTHWTSPTFYWPGGYMYMNATHHANKQSSWDVRLYKSSGKEVGYSQSNWTSTKKSKSSYNMRIGQVASDATFKKVAAGNYKLKFKKISGGTIHVTSYCVHK